MTAQTRGPAELLDRFCQVIELELKRGGQDQTVEGGLDGFLVNWRRLAAAQNLLTGFPELESYAALDPDSRIVWLEQARQWARAIRAALHRAPPSVTPTPRQAGRRPAAPSLTPEDSVTRLPRVDRVTALRLGRLGIKTVRDLVYHFPFRYEDWSRVRKIAELRPHEEATVVGRIIAVQATRLGARGLPATEVLVADETGTLRVVWFNQPYLARTFKTGTTLVLSGRTEYFRGVKVFESPEYEVYDGADELLHTGRLVPIYRVTEGLTPKTLRRLIKTALDVCLNAIPDGLPAWLRAEFDLVDLATALRQIHFPDDYVALRSARRRLAFEELFYIQVLVLSRRRQAEVGATAPRLQGGQGLVSAFIAALPFKLTTAQERVLGEVLADLGRDRPMNRLLQGDVGSGKTVVAAAAMLVAVGSGYQAALMAPTEILAEQHFSTLVGLLSGLPDGLRPRVGLLTASLARVWPRPESQPALFESGPAGDNGRVRREELYRLLQTGEVDIVVGTHALIQETVAFSKLGLVIVDEQHRFGVVQRSALRRKGENPHVLVMTATPIPRSLALTLYGDLDLSIIDELPPGRKPVKTRLIEPERRHRVYQFIRQQVERGFQAFVICPLIEESEALQVKAAEAEFERLRTEVFPDLRVGLLHGRMAAAEKERVMRAFRDRELDILVATPVVEVGIDIPNATVMVIEGAERFGLAQLHQLRGRVGRGEADSYCVLLTENASAEAVERLRLVERSHNGLELAEADLRMRGPGEYFGTRQSGLPDLKLAQVSDLSLLELAREAARRLLTRDPDLSQPEHQAILSRLHGMPLSVEVS
ncbi:MAG: DNA helicase RecG [Chloroflexota bacterium]